MMTSKRRKGRKGGVSLGDKSSFEGLLSWKEQLMTSGAIVLSSIAIRRFVGGLKWNSDDYS